MEKGKKTVYFVKTKDGARTRVDAEQSVLPLLPKERHLNYYAMLAIMTAGAIASWAFVTGGAIGVLVPLKYGICAALFGCTVAYAFHAYGCIVYARWGTDMSVVGRSTWGHRGIYVLIIGLGFTSTYGWGSMPIIMLGKSSSEVFTRLTGASGFFTKWQLWAVVALFIGLWITYVGTTVIDKITKVCAPLIVVLILFICIVLAKNYGLVESFTAMPPGVSEDRASLLRNYMIATEICLGVGFSWPFYISAYCKPAISENASYTPGVIGCGICWALCCIAPAITSALTGNSDPVAALAAIGGPFVMVWMIMLAFANFTSVMVNPYFLSCALSAMFPKLKWKHAVSIQAIYLVAIFLPIFYEQFGKCISFIGIFEATAGCIWALDYFLRKKFNLRHCYGTKEEKKKSAYWYFHGFNMASWIGLVAGGTFGLLTYNPWTGAISAPALFDLLGAMIPASIVGCIVYYVIFRFVQVPKRTGLPEMHMTVAEYNAEEAY